MISRLEKLHTILEKKHLDGILISHQPNIAYLTNCFSSDSYLLITTREKIFITDSRYYQQARQSLKGFDAALNKESIFNTIAKLSLKIKIKRLGFEAGNLNFAQYKEIKKLIHPIHFIATHSLIEELRTIKEPAEMDKIKEAVKITILALRYARDIIRPGRSEIEIAAELERFIRYKGVRTTSFDTIVAAGENSSFPHHLTSNRKIKKNEPLLIDIGVDYKGYKSDLTRTFFLGKIPFKFKSIYNIVRQAQILAIKKVKPGVKISDIDKSARQYISKNGYGGFFGHSLGHGTGLEIHEKPYISARNKGILQEGMVFTVEPAIYLPRKFGIRIEDNIWVSKKGCEVLSANLDK
ncbi:MAG: Xaa-Pro peptidase family protein [Candidatus Omnitrophota bacterium]